MPPSYQKLSIAGRLAVGGGSCPVCGSEHHPHLATSAVDAPDAAAEKALRKRLDDARRSVEGARQGAKNRAPKPRAAAVDKSLEQQMQQLDDARDGFAPPASPSPADAPKQEKAKKQNAARSRDNMF